MTAADAVDILLINAGGIGTSRLAPYQGWEKLIETAKRNYDLFIKVVGRRRIDRIGARFMNRIDVPNKQFDGFSWEQYMRVVAVLPSEVANRINSYYMNAQINFGDSEIKVIFQAGQIAPVLLDHTSIHIGYRYIL